MKKSLLAAALAVMLVAPLRAELLQWGGVSSTTPFHLLGGAPVATGSLIYTGQFPAGFNFGANMTLDSLLMNFTILDQGLMGQNQSDGSNLGPGVFFGQQAGPGGGAIPGFNAFTGAPASSVAGAALFIWVFNAATPQAATQWGIATNNASTWQFAPGALGQNSYEIADTGTFSPVGALGTVLIGGDGLNELFLGPVVVPEPSTYVLGLTGLAAMAFARRRRK